MARRTDRRVKWARRLRQNVLLELILEKGYEEVTVAGSFESSPAKQPPRNNPG